jgi:hypothetical protein
MFFKLTVLGFPVVWGMRENYASGILFTSFLEMGMCQWVVTHKAVVFLVW